MNCVKKSLGFSILFFGFISIGANGSQEFSADMITHVGGQETQSKFYSSGNKSRIEMPGSTVITRIDQMKTYICMDSEKMCMEQPINPQVIAQASVNLPGEIERQSMGREDVNGESTEKFLITYDAGNGPQKVYQWIGSQELPVKAASENGEWTVEYQNIQIGAQAPNLFELPADYQTMAMPDLSGMMQQAFQDQ